MKCPICGDDYQLPSCYLYHDREVYIKEIERLKSENYISREDKPKESEYSNYAKSYTNTVNEYNKEIARLKSENYISREDMLKSCEQCIYKTIIDQALEYNNSDYIDTEEKSIKMREILEGKA